MRDVFLGYNSLEEKKLNRMREMEFLRQGLSLLRKEKRNNAKASFIRMVADDDDMDISLRGRISEKGLKIFDIHMQGYFNVITYAGDITKVERGTFKYFKQIENGRHGIKRTVYEDAWPVEIYYRNFSDSKGMTDCTIDISQWLRISSETITIIERDPREIMKIYEEYNEYMESLNDIPKN